MLLPLHLGTEPVTFQILCKMIQIAHSRFSDPHYTLDGVIQILHSISLCKVIQRPLDAQKVNQRSGPHYTLDKVIQRYPLHSR